MISAMDIVASVPTCLYLTLPVLKIVLISSHEDSVQPDEPLTHADFAFVQTPSTFTYPMSSAVSSVNNVSISDELRHLFQIRIAEIAP